MYLLKTELKLPVVILELMPGVSEETIQLVEKVARIPIIVQCPLRVAKQQIIYLHICQRLSLQN